MTSRNKTLGKLIPAIRSRLIPIILITAAVAGVLLVYLFLPGQDKTTSAEPAAPIPVRSELIHPVQAVRDTFELKGIAGPKRFVKVRSELSEKVVAIGRTADGSRELRKGDAVETGQVLVRLRTDRLQADLARAEAQLAYDRTQLVRMKELAPQGAASPRNIEDAKKQVQISQALVKTANANLARATIVAEIAGTINWLIEPGELTQQGGTNGTQVAEIVDNSERLVTIAIPEIDVAYFHEGAVEQIIDWPGKQPDDAPIKATVTFLSARAQSDVHSTIAELTLDAPGREKIRNGHIVSVELLRQIKTDVVMIPLFAIVPGENDLHYVHVAEGGRAHRRQVRINLRMIDDVGQVGQFDSADRVEVISGLVPLERLIVEGTRGLSDGQPIRERTIQLADPIYAKYQLAATSDRRIRPEELSELVERFGNIEGVLSARPVEPSDFAFEISLNLAKLKLLGLTGQEFFEWTESDDVGRPPEGSDLAGPIRLMIRTEKGASADQLLQRVLVYRPDGRPIYLSQVVEKLPEIPPADPLREMDLTVRLDGAGKEFLAKEITPILIRAARAVPGVEITDRTADGRAQLHLAVPETIELRKAMLQIGAAMSRLTGELPTVAPMPSLVRAQSDPLNRVVVRVSRDQQGPEVLARLEKAVDSFCQANNTESAKGQLTVKRIDAASLAADSGN